MNDRSLHGLRVAITGGTSGLGLALVESAARARRAGRLRRPQCRNASRHRHRPPGTHGIVGDVARKDDIHPIALEITAALGGLDVLVNNASSLGPVPLALLADTECEDLEAALATNVGPFRLTKALLGALAASARAGRRPQVINITSDAAVTPYAGWGAYGASKAALRTCRASGARSSCRAACSHGSTPATWNAAARAGGTRCRPGHAEAARRRRAMSTSSPCWRQDRCMKAATTAVQRPARRQAAGGRCRRPLAP